MKVKEFRNLQMDENGTLIDLGLLFRGKECDSAEKILDALKDYDVITAKSIIRKVETALLQLKR